ncbi:MAG: DNA-binding response regulator [Bacteroidetes bacterium HGW-Bacteroidetes-3]|jgi:DNA-binding LytR/AlgR family response regulator|nr:MAG: DNA-binding response regulator [Bacteroidetes bacterium HGW-Bacteroidetes-3]
MKINCLIIDDEPTSQIVLKNYIADVDFLHLSGVFNNAIEALHELKNNHSIDLLFLDVNMPKISGLTFYKSLQNPPDVIFTTAYSQYAVDGFEVNAIDFLLKPFSFDRFFIAVNKVLEKKFPIEINNNESHFLLIKSNKTIHKICSNDILFIEAYGDYVKIYVEDKYILTNNTFANILELLPKNKFMRSHKSFAINLEKINTIQGNRIAINKHLIPIGQKFKVEFLKSLNHN